MAATPEHCTDGSWFQVELIKRKINQSKNKLEVRVATVDSFQGQEAQIVIYSCVRANEQGGELCLVLA